MKRPISSIAIAMLLFILLPLKARAAQLLIPVGKVIGLQLSDDTVTIAAFDDVLGACAKDAGLKIGDEILEMEDCVIHSPQDVRSILDSCDDDVELTVRRNGKLHTLELEPRDTPDGKKMGVYLRQGIAGIGTVTWYDPENRTFGALGHGVSTPKGSLLEMTTGNAYPAQVRSVIRGKSGEPGQLKGSADDAFPLGNLYRNTAQGVFGKTHQPWRGEPLPVADFSDVHPGPATIRSTVTGSGVQEYSVEILKIYPQNRPDNRNFLLRVTDTELLNTTGGIVQGMGVSYNKDNQWNP